MDATHCSPLSLGRRGIALGLSRPHSGDQELLRSCRLVSRVLGRPDTAPKGTPEQSPDDGGHGGNVVLGFSGQLPQFPVDMAFLSLGSWFLPAVTQSVPWRRWCHGVWTCFSLELDLAQGSPRCYFLPGWWGALASLSFSRALSSRPASCWVDPRVVESEEMPREMKVMGHFRLLWSCIH